MAYENGPEKPSVNCFRKFKRLQLTFQVVLKINDTRCKGGMGTSIGSFFLYPSYGDGSAHADRLHLSAWLCDCGISRHAHDVARSPSSHILLAHLHASRLSRAQDLGRDCQVDASYPHRLALWTLAQSRLLERASHRELVGAGSRGYLASTGERHPSCISLAMAATPTNGAPRILSHRKGVS